MESHAGPAATDKVRIDRWLWSVRLFKTRSAAADACKAGHVTVNGKRVKPAATVTPGDVVQARVHDRDRILDVVAPISQRVGARIAVDCYIDRSPPPPQRDDLAFFEGVRERGAGRPTKKERRETEKLKGERRKGRRGSS